MVFNLSDNNSIVKQYLSEVRDKAVQRDPSRFRRNMERMGFILAYEISKTLSYTKRVVETPLARTEIETPESLPVLITVLRAGLPFFNGFLDVFDQSPCGFIGAYRKEGGDAVTIKLDYLATPSLEDRDVLLIDPMLATGLSFMQSVQSLLAHGRPRKVYVAALVAAPDGINYIQKNMPVPFDIWTAAIDERLNDKFYIVPGLGDAGDLSFGEKL